MEKYEKFIKRQRLIFGILFAAITLVCLVCLILALQKPVDVSVEEKKYYNDVSQTSTVDLTFKFDGFDGSAVPKGKIKIAFVDSSNKVIATHTLAATGQTVRFSDVPGNVQSVKIVSHTIKVFGGLSHENWYSVPIVVLVVLLAFLPFLLTLSLNFSTFNVGETVVSVYSGFRNHKLFINDELADEYMSVIYYTPIILSSKTADGKKIEVRISPSNKVTVKCDDKLLRKN